MQIGTVVQIDLAKRLFVVLIDGRDYTVWEHLGAANLVVGSCLKGPLYGLGDASLRDMTSGLTFEAFGHTGPCSLASCRGILKG